MGLYKRAKNELNYGSIKIEKSGKLKQRRNKREKDRERMCVRVCVREREKERERESKIRKSE